MTNKFFSYLNTTDYDVHDKEIIITHGDLPNLYNDKERVNKNYYNGNTSYYYSNPITNKNITNKIQIENEGKKRILNVDASKTLVNDTKKRKDLDVQKGTRKIERLVNVNQLNK